MEWYKIKTMFIYLFLFLNIILIVAYFYIINLSNAEFYQEKDAIIKSIKNDNIDVIDPQLKKENLGYVSATINELKEPNIKIDNYNYELIKENYGNKLLIKFEEPITNVNNSNYKEALNKFILENLEEGSNYIFDYYDEKNKSIVYRQTIDGLKIYNNDNAVIKFELDNFGNVKSVMQSSLSNVKKDNIEPIASYNQAINKLYHENYIHKNSKVIPSLGYYTSASKLANQVLIPVWRIEVKYTDTKKYFYVDAINIKVLEKKQ